MQDQTKIATLVLKYLFERYIQDCGSRPYEIANLIEQRGANPLEIAELLKQEDVVKNVTFLPGGEIHAEISPRGLREIDEGFIAHSISKVIAALINNKNQPVSLLETTEIPNREFSMAFDLMEIMKIDDYYEVNPSLTKRDFIITFNKNGYTKFINLSRN